MSIRISVFENQWGDRLEIYKTYLKIIIKSGLITTCNSIGVVRIIIIVHQTIVNRNAIKSIF